MEEQKRRAEADKLAAITALEVRSREFMVEKEEKRRLEARITSMQSQLLIGGHKIEDMPVFRSILRNRGKSWFCAALRHSSNGVCIILHEVPVYQHLRSPKQGHSQLYNAMPGMVLKQHYFNN